MPTKLKRQVDREATYEKETFIVSLVPPGTIQIRKKHSPKYEEVSIILLYQWLKEEKALRDQRLDRILERNKGDH